MYKYFRRTEARSRGKIIGVRWVDSLKWDIVKSRLVTMVILADTPSQEKPGVIFSRPSVMDVKRAFLEDNVDEEIYIELPDSEEVPGVHRNADQRRCTEQGQLAECGGRL